MNYNLFETNKTKIIVAILLIVFGVLMRLIPHMWNFTPIVAISLFAGVHLGKKFIAPIIIVMMLVSDFVIGFYSLPVMISVYGSFMLIGVLSYLIKKDYHVVTIASTSIVSSIIFYIITNFAVWKFGSMYSQTIDGLMLSYTMGLPFLRNMLFGDLIFCAILFGVYEFAILFAKIYHQRKLRIVK